MKKLANTVVSKDYPMGNIVIVGKKGIFTSLPTGIQLLRQRCTGSEAKGQTHGGPSFLLIPAAKIKHGTRVLLLYLYPRHKLTLGIPDSVLCLGTGSLL